MRKKTTGINTPFVSTVYNASGGNGWPSYQELIEKYKEPVYLKMMDDAQWHETFRKTDWGNNAKQKEVARSAYKYWNEAMVNDRRSRIWPKPHYPDVESIQEGIDRKKRELEMAQKVKEAEEYLATETARKAAEEAARVATLENQLAAYQSGAVNTSALTPDQVVSAPVANDTPTPVTPDDNRNRTILIVGGVLILLIAIYFLFFKKK